jgi:hypothetical protein
MNTPDAYSMGKTQGADQMGFWMGHVIETVRLAEHPDADSALDDLKGIINAAMQGTYRNPHRNGHAPCLNCGKDGAKTTHLLYATLEHYSVDCADCGVTAGIAKREAPMVMASVTTRHPENYLLVNEADDTRWRMNEDGEWKAADR